MTISFYTFNPTLQTFVLYVLYFDLDVGGGVRFSSRVAPARLSVPGAFFGEQNWLHMGRFFLEIIIVIINVRMLWKELAEAKHLWVTR